MWQTYLLADHQAAAVKLKSAEKSLKDFCNATGQDRDRFREQVLGFGRSEAQRAVQADKKAKKALTYVNDSGIIRYKRIVDAVKSNKITLKLNPEKQNPHILGAPGYDASKNKSYFNITLEEVQELVNGYHGTGEVRVYSNGQIKEVFAVEEEIGVVISQTGEIIGKSNRIKVHYSEKERMLYQ